MQRDRDRRAAAQAIQQALTAPRWGQKDLTRHKVLTQRLIAQLALHRGQPEVDDFLNRLYRNPSQVDSRELHYVQRRYVDGRPFQNVAELDALYTRILEDPGALVYRKGGLRYQVCSPREGWIAILEPDGTRVSVYPDLNDDLGEPLWTVQALIP